MMEYILTKIGEANGLPAEIVCEIASYLRCEFCGELKGVKNKMRLQFCRECSDRAIKKKARDWYKDHELFNTTHGRLMFKNLMTLDGDDWPLYTNEYNFYPTSFTKSRQLLGSYQGNNIFKDVGNYVYDEEIPYMSKIMHFLKTLLDRTFINVGRNNELVYTCKHKTKVQGRKHIRLQVFSINSLLTGVLKFIEFENIYL
jgi:esterase/lipase superfamily enzyme